MNLNVKDKTIKLLEYLYGLGAVNSFFVKGIRDDTKGIIQERKNSVQPK